MYFVLSLVLPSSSNGKLIIFIFWSSRPLFLLDLGWYFFRPLLIYDYVYVTCNTLTMWCYYYWPQWEWGRVPFIWLITQPGCLPRTRPQCPSPVSDLNKRYAEFGLVRVVLPGSPEAQCDHYYCPALSCSPHYHHIVLQSSSSPHKYTIFILTIGQRQSYQRALTTTTPLC